ncbi:MAG: hypothetical protein QM658_13640 [Gordonia sp. (in: high G+C Gram-positive bacteria)]
MFVLTADQRGSRRGPDRVPDLLDHYSALSTVRPLDRTAGDEVQAAFDDARTVARLAVELTVTSHWTVGIGAGPVNLPLPAQTRAGSGPAFEAARRAVESAKGERIPLHVDGDSSWCAQAQTAAHLLVDLIASRTDAGREAVALRQRGLSQSEAAAALGISPQAVSLRLRTARWDLQPPAEELLVRVLEQTQSAG